MIKYLREKIIGRAVNEYSDMPSIEKTHSQHCFNDIVSTSTNSNDIISNDQTTSQVEKLTGAGVDISSGRRFVSSSSSIIIPKKPSHSNASSSQSSSSYTTVGDQMSSMGETLIQSHHETDDALCITLPTLSCASQQLEHSAARDRIAVKNKLRQPIKQKLTTLEESDSTPVDLFSSVSIYEGTSSLPQIESKVHLQPTVDVSDLNTARSRLRVHSPEKVLLTTPIIPTYVSSIQRSISLKRPQEIKVIKQSIFTRENDDDQQEERQSVSCLSSEEHIYDNLDLFKPHKTQVTSDIVASEYQSATNLTVETREHSTCTTTHLRPVTVHLSSNNDQELVNEFENVFNQLKKRTLIRKVRSREELISESPPPPPVPEEPVQIPLLSVSVPAEEEQDEKPKPLLTENEPIVPNITPKNKTVESSLITQPPNRRKTVGGVYLPVNNKVATTDTQPTVSWIDIAKQKQSKFQSIATEKPHHHHHHHHEESEQQETSTTAEPTVVSRKQVTISSNLTMTKDNTSDDIRSNRKSMFEPAITRRPSPLTTAERDSIRALKADKPNRINNLIQLFDK